MERGEESIVKSRNKGLVWRCAGNTWQRSSRKARWQVNFGETSKAQSPWVSPITGVLPELWARFVTRGYTRPHIRLLLTVAARNNLISERQNWSGGTRPVGLIATSSRVWLTSPRDADEHVCVSCPIHQLIVTSDRVVAGIWRCLMAPKTNSSLPDNN